MKKSNNKTLSAILIGISSMMVLSTPITAYASNPDDEQNDIPENPAVEQGGEETGEENNQTPEEEKTDAEVIAEAQAQAQTTQEAVSDAQEQAQGTPEETPAEENQNPAGNESEQENQETTGEEQQNPTGGEGEHESIGEQGAGEGEEQQTTGEQGSEEANQQNQETGGEEQQNQETTGGETAQTVDGASDKILDAGIEEDIQNSGTLSAAALTELKDAAEAVENDANISTAKENINDISEALDNIAAQETNSSEKEDVIKTVGWNAAGDAAKIEDRANEAETAVSTADNQISGLLDNLQNASTVDDANTAYAAINDMVTSADTTVSQKKAAIQELTSSYNEAIGILEAAQEAYEAAQESIDQSTAEAAQKIETAQQELQVAQTKVDNLKDALDNATLVLANEAEFQTNMQDTFVTFTPNSNPNTEARRQTMMDAVTNYILPLEEQLSLTRRVTGDNPLEQAGDYKWEYVSGFERQDYNYCKVTYLDADGNECSRYYNWDHADKQFNPNDRWANLGTSYGFFAFEKSQEEIEANDYLHEYFGANYGQENWYKKGILKGNTVAGTVDGVYTSNVVRYMANNGYYDVFAYTENGSTVYMVREELIDYINSGTIQVDEATNEMSINGNTIHEVVQNKNNLFHDANVYLIATESDAKKYLYQDKNRYVNKIKAALSNSLDNADAISDKIDAIYQANAKMNGFIQDANVQAVEDLSGKYFAYSAAVNSAVDAVETANEEAEKLATAIGKLQNRRASAKALTAAEVFKTDDVAAFLGVTVPEGVNLNEKTVPQALSYLNSLLTEANGKIASAEETLETLKTLRDNAATNLAQKIADLTPAETPVTETPASGGTETPAAETPAVETPVSGGTETPTTPTSGGTETPAAEAPTSETPASSDTETPASGGTETPAAEAPTSETPTSGGTETSAAETPETPASSGTETPASGGTETPAAETLASSSTETPAAETPASSSTETPVAETPAPETPAATTTDSDFTIPATVVSDIITAMTVTTPTETVSEVADLMDFVADGTVTPTVSTAEAPATTIVAIPETALPAADSQPAPVMETAEAVNTTDTAPTVLTTVPTGTIIIEDGAVALADTPGSIQEVTSGNIGAVMEDDGSKLAASIDQITTAIENLRPTTIEDDGVALASTFATENVKITASKLEDEGVALSATPGTLHRSPLGWLVALAGSAGFGLYLAYKNRKDEEENSDKVN